MNTANKADSKFNLSSGALETIQPIFEAVAAVTGLGIKIAKKGWAAVRYVFNDPTAERLNGGSNNKVLASMRRRWREIRAKQSNSFKIQHV